MADANQQAGTAGTTGTVSAPGSTPATGVSGTGHGTVIYPGGIKARSWQESPRGASLGHGYDVVRTAFAVTMPGQLQQFQHLTHRPLGG